MMIVNVPIEPIEERYSADWNRWFQKELVARKYKFETICPAPLTTKIREGAFLDIVGTTYFKAEQIRVIAQMVEDKIIPRDEKVVFLIHDGWFPVEQLAYMRDMLGCHDWKFIGIFHDGTYDKWDMTARHNMYTWGEDLENSWFKIYDKVIVATEFHKEVLLSTRKITHSSIVVIPWKVEVARFDNIPKENIIVFPHRLTEDKNIVLFSEMSDWISTSYPHWTIIRTKDLNLSKHEYNKLLAKSKISVSTALLEMFGIAMLESVLLGCVPLVPDRLAYKEMYPAEFRYADMKEFKEKLSWFCNHCNEYDQHLVQLRDKFIINSNNFFDSIFDVVENV